MCFYLGLSEGANSVTDCCGLLFCPLFLDFRNSLQEDNDLQWLSTFGAQLNHLGTLKHGSKDQAMPFEPLIH